jgi:hypothetical protein
MMQNDNFAKFQLAQNGWQKISIQFIIGRGGGGISALLFLLSSKYFK